MTYEEFKTKYDGKGIDFDGYYGFQCMDLAHQYATEVCGHDFAPAPAAKDVWNETIDGYDKIANTPDGVPQPGDIIIWGTAIGAYGHIAVFDHGDSNTFTSFDQNWPLNSLCHLQNHNYNGVLGWFHPKNPAIIAQPIAQEITDQTKVDMGDDGVIEVQAARSLLHDRKNTINDQFTKITDLSKQLQDCQNKPVEAPQAPETTPVVSSGGTPTIAIGRVQPQPSLKDIIAGFFQQLWKN